MKKSNIVCAALLVFGLGAGTSTSAQENPETIHSMIDYLSFVNGALPLGVSGDGAQLKSNYEHAIKAIDGNTGGFVLTPKPGTPETFTVLHYELPATTTFSRFSVPNILETPSPYQTFVSLVEVYGSAEGVNSGFVKLAEHKLETHSEKNQTTTFDANIETGVKWINIRLSGGINIEVDKTFYEFSEIVGHGAQEPVPMNNGFTGIWKGRGVLLETSQTDSLVTGCYDRTGDLSGSVSGNIMKATGVDRNTDVLSLFVLSVTEDGLLRGLRSTNGAPFKVYFGDIAPEGTQTDCSEPSEVVLGCGSIVHGINFDFDSAVIQPESSQVIDQLYSGLQQSPEASIVIEGHTSSEGSEQYNRGLSEQRAQAVVNALINLGISNSRITALGKGESDPIASNDDEAGRGHNRRVEINCSS